MKLVKRLAIPSGMRWRLFEAAVALIALLISGQLSWLAWLNISERLQENSRRIWLLPTERNKNNDQYVQQKEQLGSQGTMLNVTDPQFRFTVFGPPQQKLEIWFNEEKHEESTIYEAGQFSGSVWLKRGNNRIETRTPHEFSADDSAAVSFHKPSLLLTPVLLGVIPVDESYVTIVGYAEPDCIVELFELPSRGQPIRQVQADAIGIFYVEHFPVAALSSAMEASVKLSDKMDQSTARYLFKTSTQADVVAMQLNRQMRIQIVGSHINLQYRLKLPDPAWTPKPNLSYWQYLSGLTPQQAISSFFGICAGPTRAASESADKSYTGASCGSRFSSPTPIWTLNGVPPRLKVTDDELEVTLQGVLPSDGLSLIIDHQGHLAAPLLASPQDRIELITDEHIQVDTVQSPNEEQPGIKIWHGRRALPGRGLLAELQLSSAVSALQPSPATKPAQPAESQIEPVREEPETVTLRTLSYKVPGPIAGLLRALLGATPFVWLLWILHHRTPRRWGYRRALAACAATFLIFHLTVLSLSFFHVGFGFSSLVAQASGQPTNWVKLFDSVGKIFPFWSFGLIFVIRPAFLAFVRINSSLTVKRKILFQLGRWLIFWPLVLAVPPFLFLKVSGMEYVMRSETSLSSAKLNGWSALLPPNALATAVLVTAFAFVATCFYLYWVFRVFGRTLGARSVLVTCGALLFLPIVPPLLASTLAQLRNHIVTAWRYYPTWIPQNSSSIAWFVIIVWVGAALLMCFAQITAHQLNYAPSRIWFRPGIRRLSLFLIFALASIPLAYFRPDAKYGFGVWELTELARAVDFLLPYALLPGLLILIRKANPNDSFEIPVEAASVGVLLFAYYLAGRSVNLFFIPVPLILGWWVFTRWALENKVDFGSRLPFDELKELVTKLVRHSELLNLARSRRKALEKK